MYYVKYKNARDMNTEAETFHEALEIADNDLEYDIEDENGNLVFQRGFWVNK